MKADPKTVIMPDSKQLVSFGSGLAIAQAKVSDANLMHQDRELTERSGACGLSIRDRLSFWLLRHARSRLKHVFAEHRHAEDLQPSHIGFLLLNGLDQRFSPFLPLLSRVNKEGEDAAKTTHVIKCDRIKHFVVIFGRVVPRSLGCEGALEVEAR